MAARRVVMLLIGVLVLASVVAAFLPTPPRHARGPGRTSTDAASERDAKPKRRGRLVEATVDASTRRPHVVRARRGDELSLAIRSAGADQVEIPAFGLIESVSRDDPARFDFLVDQPGRYEVRLVDLDRSVARIVAR